MLRYPPAGTRVLNSFQTDPVQCSHSKETEMAILSEVDDSNDSRSNGAKSVVSGKPGGAP